MSEHADWTEQDAEALRVAVGQFVRAGRGHSEIPPAQANVLGALDRDGPMTIVELADRLRIRHQSVRETVATLSGQDLIATVRSPEDARKVICTITAAGRSRLDADRHARSAWILDRVRRLAPAQQRAALGIAELLQALSSDDLPAGPRR
jgi:DNA-binding MarR family transcriptional regulator